MTAINKALANACYWLADRCTDVGDLFSRRVAAALKARAERLKGAGR